MNSLKPRAALLYQFFHPDDVVSARHYADFAEGLRDRGWEVHVWTSNRACRDDSIQYSRTENWRGIHIHRIRKPRFKPGSNLGRLVSIIWMITAWTLALGRPRRDYPDVIVIGTDPPLSIFTAFTIRLFRPSARVAHWCFDLFPEAAVADGMIAAHSRVEHLLKKFARAAYHNVALLADLGPCMRRRLRSYGHRAAEVTLVPWALVEPNRPNPPDPAVRTKLFGDASLSLLYSGNFGRAHAHQGFLELARMLRADNVTFAFGMSGNRADYVKESVQAADVNIRVLGFAPESELEARLSSADIHLVSLRSEWEGIVVPSKFFGSLAAGRPVLFDGPEASSIAQWIREYQVGWVLTPESMESVAAELRTLASSKDHLHEMQQRCHAVYQKEFSKRVTLDRWDQALRRL